MTYVNRENQVFNERCFRSLAFLACNTVHELRQAWFNGSAVYRAIPMPPIPTLLEMYKPGLTPALVQARTQHFLNNKDEVWAGRKRRNECRECGKRHGTSFACLSN